MFQINSIDTDREKSYFLEMENDVINNIDIGSSIKNNGDKIIQYTISDNIVYVKTIYRQFYSSKYNHYNLFQNQVLYRYDVKDSGSLIYSGYEIEESDSSGIRRFDISNNIENIYINNKFKIEEFNIKLIRKDNNNKTESIYYYLIEQEKKQNFLKFLANKDKIKIDLYQLENILDSIFLQINDDKPIGFGYKGLENNYSIYAIF